MKNLWNKFLGLSIIWKLIIIAALIIGAVVVYDAATGKWSDISNWWYDKKVNATLQKVDELQKENDALRAEKKEYERLAVEAKAKEAVFDEKEKTLDAKTKAELQKLDEALAQQDKEEAITEQDTDAYTRCERTKQKMIDLKIKAAGDINCDEFKK